MIKFIYSEKATKFCKIFTLLLTVCTVVKSKVKISQNCVAFSEYMNFKISREIRLQPHFALKRGREATIQTLSVVFKIIIWRSEVALASNSNSCRRHRDCDDWEEEEKQLGHEPLSFVLPTQGWRKVLKFGWDKLFLWYFPPKNRARNDSKLRIHWEEEEKQLGQKLSTGPAVHF